MSKVIALTGGIGSGKTYVANLFKDLAGIPCFYSDHEAKKIMNNDDSVKSEIISIFGPNSYINNNINIEFLRKEIFNSQNKLEKSTSFFGNDTNSAINSGVQRGVISELDQIIYEYNELNPNAIVVLCGGDAFYLQKELKSTIFVNQNLVLIGLNEILDYNV